MWVWTPAESTTTDLKEMREVVEEAENGRDAPASGNASEENGELEADKVDKEEEEGGQEEKEEGDGETEDGDEDSKKEKLNLRLPIRV